MKFMQNKIPVVSVWTKFAAIAVVALLSACATSMNPAPVTDRSKPGMSGGEAGTATTASSSPNAMLGPFADKAGQPGYYTVKRGDTLMRIALESGQDWRDIARWNSMDNANLIEVNQVLRVQAPVAVAAVSGSRVEGKPLASPVAGAASAPGVAAGSPLPNATADDEDLVWAWPAASAVLAGFDEVKNKGLDLAGKAGDPVFAAADGRVVYAGAAVRGYGNLVIIKHNNTFITAYAHNQAILVKDSQVVKRGQRIAEMGSSDTDRVKLHFEVRKQGKPVDPLKWLPSK